MSMSEDIVCLARRMAADGCPPRYMLATPGALQALREELTDLQHYPSVLEITEFMGLPVSVRPSLPEHTSVILTDRLDA